MSLIPLDVYYEGNTGKPLRTMAVQLTTNLAAHATITHEGRLFDPGSWTVTHIGSGMELLGFEHWDPEPAPPEIPALRRFAAWLELQVDLGGTDGAAVDHRIDEHATTDFTAVIAFYKDQINNWADPVDCRCGSHYAHPVAGQCWRCRTRFNGATAGVSAGQAPMPVPGPADWCSQPQVSRRTS
ncbi:hypothetical protein D2E64_23370 [Mycobacteroides abscessus]|uniref:hypothetical protein n=1 Tax=Mycobacteroides abscessus TaxID=36809 RepID=UPI0002E0670B|nr:hypothetical protein [Mycobacteroides abscessus]MBN7567170.1 hypothetical protein [Mycobacteroides abscessus subsp. massiliense]PVA72236.1 hypothetical protein DDJ76_22810 [Mycobacteroides abscessus]RIS03908.1 hypothetical protein D2E63_22430 [Mycobacteroides abscessus]RIS11335.1 hypothetical protein D2E69_22380 [Mycobacteroides abscessus]RIS23560.1 hypothetical protein D2E67_22075 [Mycobacteroides abscessus]